MTLLQKTWSPSSILRPCAFVFTEAAKQEGSPWSEVGNFMSFTSSFLICRKQGKIEKMKDDDH